MSVAGLRQQGLFSHLPSPRHCLNVAGMRSPLALIVVLAAALLAACGGASNNGGSNTGGGSSSGGTSTPGRGTLLQNPPTLLSTVSAADLLAQVTTGASSQTFGAQALAQVLALTGVPSCDVNVYHIEYNTVGGANESTTASGALMVPSGSGASCQGARPIVLYAHGTSTERNFNIADLTNQQNAEGILLAAFFAARGYIVVAPNYAGYDTSTLDLPSISGCRSAIEGHDRCLDGGSLCSCYQLAGQRQRPAVHHRILAGRLRGDGDTSRDAGRRHDGHRFGADVRSICARGFRRCGI